jgi:hypothetical protein
MIWVHGSAAALGTSLQLDEHGYGRTALDSVATRDSPPTKGAHVRHDIALVRATRTMHAGERMQVAGREWETHSRLCGCGAGTRTARTRGRRDWTACGQQRVTCRQNTRTTSARTWSRVGDSKGEVVHEYADEPWGTL